MVGRVVKRAFYLSVLFMVLLSSLGPALAAALATLSLSFPGDGTRIGDATPAFDWSDATSPPEATYNLQVDYPAD